MKLGFVFVPSYYAFNNLLNVKRGGLASPWNFDILHLAAPAAGYEDTDKFAQKMW
jgi:hypothetical protein